MTKELEQAVEEYNEYDIDSVGGVYPISGIDAFIISSLMSKLNELRVNSKFMKILKLWKKISDNELLYMIDEFEVPVRTRDFIEVEGYIIPVSDIFSIKSVDGYDNKAFIPIFKVVINETENVNISTSNIEIVFREQMGRESCIENIKKRLLEFTHIRFL